jgi:Ca2+-transporting ATPase
MEKEAVLAELKTSRQGLSFEEARARLELYGRNELIERKKGNPLMMFLGQFTDFMIVVLIVAAVISGIIGEIADAIAIIVIVVLNAVLGFVQEYRAERAMEALKKMAASSATVARAGGMETVPASELVPGDIVTLEAGRIVPADLRVLEAVRLNIDEASLTGESLPVGKYSRRIDQKQLSLGDRKNMLYKGTVVTSGRGTGIVTATGMETELGRIAAMLQGEEGGRTPLQKRLAHFGRRLALAILAICAIIFIAGLFRGERPIEVFLIAVSLAVAAIPEALPAVVTISLALGAGKMVKLNALVRKLPAVETLGSVTYICSDKTGTLTENRMTVEDVWFDGKTVRSSEFGMRNGKNRGSNPVDPQSVPRDPYSLLMTAMALNNDACLNASCTVVGDPTETALFSAAQKNGFGKNMLETEYPRVEEITFDSERKLMTTFHSISGAGTRGSGSKSACNYVSFTKGAIESLIEKTEYVLTAEGPKRIERGEILRVNDRMAGAGQRVIGFAMRTWERMPGDLSSASVEAGLTLVGLAGMLDPPREEARESVMLCRSAGIVPVMITGDHPLTAAAVARRVGILDRDGTDAVITGGELASLSLEDFEKRVESIRVYARVAPEQKLKIVRALQDKGHFVAMTGDGVNDAPALKAANIGVSMGITGTDVAKEASSMILLDDNFATIVEAVKEGRRIYDNIRKFIKYLLSTNSGEIWTLFLAPFFGLPVPLQPIHILWINLLTDGLPALALSLEPEEGDVMKRPPRSPDESIFAHGLGVHAVWVGLLMAAVTLSLQTWAIQVGDVHWQTMVFSVLCFLQLGHVLAIRSERQSLFTQGLFTNTFLAGSVIMMVILQMLTIYVPALNPVFKTQPLSAPELALVFVLSSLLFLSVEIEKLIKRRQKTA